MVTNKSVPNIAVSKNNKNFSNNSKIAYDVPSKNDVIAIADLLLDDEHNKKKKRSSNSSNSNRKLNIISIDHLDIHPKFVL